jgi:hypothetical protein
MPKVLAPISVPWTMKTLASARIVRERGDDGRLKVSIAHDVCRGVTPRMLAWWFGNVEGTYKIGDHEHPRFRVSHPRDHVAFSYLRPGLDGQKLGRGAVVRLQECFGADARFAVDMSVTVDALDETGFSYRKTFAGLTTLVTEHRFAALPEGTRYETVLTVGVAGAPLLNRRVPSRFADDAMLDAWSLHTVEEVGNFERFLPHLYRAAAQLGLA